MPLRRLAGRDRSAITDDPLSFIRCPRSAGAYRQFERIDLLFSKIHSHKNVLEEQDVFPQMTARIRPFLWSDIHGSVGPTTLDESLFATRWRAGQPVRLT
jgi:hypothetical protein